MQRVLQFLRGSLVGTQNSLGVRLQINRDLACARDISRLLVVFEILTIDLIKARGVATVKSNGHIVQFRAQALLKLDGLLRLQLEQRPSLLRFRDRESLRALLNLDADLARDLLERILYPVFRIKICSQNRHTDKNRSPSKPAAQARRGDGHWR